MAETGNKTGRKTSGKKAAKPAAKKNGAKRTAKSASPAKRRPDKRTIAKKKRFISNEVAVIAFSFFALFLLFSNFNLTGRAGAVASSVEMGLFGLIGYVFPFIVIVIVISYVKNREGVFARAKLVTSCFLVAILSSLMHLLFGSDYGFDLIKYYEAGAQRELGGGAVGGIISYAFSAFAGTIGAYLILVVLLIIGVVFVTERSFVNAVKKGSEKTVIKAREGHEKFKENMELRREERLRRREEKEELRDGFLFGDDDLPEEKYEEDPIKPIYSGFGDDIIGDYEASDKNGDSYGYNDDFYDDFGPEGDLYDDFYSEEVPYDERESGENNDTSEFRGNISIPEDYDYDEDSVPFDETAEDMYKVYRNGKNAMLNAGSAVARTYGESVLDFDTAAREGYAAGFEEERYAGRASGEGEYPADGASEAFEEGGEPAGYGTYKHDPEALDKDYSDMMSFKTFNEQFPPSYEKTVVRTASGKELAEVEGKDDLLLKKRREAMRENDVEPGRKMSPDTYESEGGQSPERAARSTQAENSAVAEEIKKKEVVKKPYVFPPLSLLKKGAGSSSFDRKALKETAVKLQQTLKTFGVGVTVTNVACGPSVTRYELTLEQGVKVSKITSLTDDIKYALAAEEIRIEAPIPGKSAVGIEVPNKDNSIVYFRDIIDNDEFRSFKSKLAFGVGKDIGGRNVITDLAKMPHVLIAGATGSGKSVCINTLIMSLIYKSSPDDVRMIMVDPKVVELSVYNGIPHLLIPVVTEPKKAAAALNWAVAEMTDRYKKFAETGTRDLKGYNERVETVRKSLETKGEGGDAEMPEKLPQIVIIIDELADLMMIASAEVEASIIRLAQLARAAGIHLVIATQRPSVNVITGLIKANVPSRIAFKVSSGVDSRTILDMNGAEKLLGYGDMLFFPSGAPKPSRIQGSFISDSEVQAVVDFLKKDGEAQYSDEIKNSINSDAPGNCEQGARQNDRDEYFEQAGRLIIEKDKASIGMLQRVYKIGFNRAARIMDQLCEAGVVGPEEGTKPRKVCMNAEEFERII